MIFLRSSCSSSSCLLPWAGVKGGGIGREKERDRVSKGGREKERKEGRE